MKRAPFLLLAFLLAPLSRAEDSLSLSSQLLDINGTAAFLQQSLEAGVKPFLDNMRTQGAPADLVESIHVEARAFFAENFKWDLMKPEIAKIYAGAFTEAELRDMLAFYRSPTGQKTVEKMPVVTLKTMERALSGVQAHMPDFQQRVGALIQDYKKRADAAAAPAASGTPGTTAVPTPVSK